jgi:CheY-like chemotaxis protein
MGDTKQINLLLIDDNEIDQLLHRKIIELSFPQASITQFLNAPEALQFLQQSTFTDTHFVVLLDIKMPSMDGFQFLEAFDKLNGELKTHFTIYLLSSSLNQFDISRAKSNKYVKDMIIKPLTSDTLLNLLA